MFTRQDKTRQDKTRPSRLNQSGVAHLLYPILGLAVVAVIAGAGFYVYQQNNSGAGATTKTFKIDVNSMDRKAACARTVRVDVYKRTSDQGSLKLGTGKQQGTSKCKKSGVGYRGDFNVKVNIKSVKGKYRANPVDYDVTVGNDPDTPIHDYNDEITFSNPKFRNPVGTVDESNYRYRVLWVTGTQTVPGCGTLLHTPRKKSLNQINYKLSIKHCKIHESDTGNPTNN